MILEILIAVVVAIGTLAAAFVVLRKPIEKYFRRLGDDIAEKSAKTAEERARVMHKEERERMDERYKGKEQVLEEKIKSGDKSIKESRNSIKEMVDNIGRELAKHQQKLETSEKERANMFGALKKEVESQSKVTEGLKHSADDLKNILSNNQLRGKYGEEVAENLLKTVGFVKGQNYILNKSQDTTKSRPDVTILLPDKTKINIDSKFPFTALISYQEAEDKSEQERHIKQFAQDVKAKIKEVTSRDYISPEEGTVDFVILFVPNEMIFSFIYDKLHDVWNDALHKKVVLAGPFSFTAILRMIYQSYKNFTYQENMQNIIKLVKTFEQEWVKYSDSVDGLGRSIDTVNNKYRDVSTTRSNQLGRIMDKIRGEDVLPEPESKKLLT